MVASSGAASAQEAMDNLCAQQEQVLSRLERAGILGDIGPMLNEEQDPSYWLGQEGAPKPELENEDPQPITIGYDELIQSWENN